MIQYIKYGGVLAAAAYCAVANGRDTSRPNVIVIVTDDMGCGDIAPMPHNEAVFTPNLSRLAAQGVTFVQGYASAPMSLPSRVGMLTGCYPAHCGAYKVDAVQGLPEGIPTIAEHLQSAGYATAMIGKWHAGGEFLEWRRPENRGFDRTFYWFDSTHDYWDARIGRTNTWGAVGYAPVYDQGKEMKKYETGYLTTDISQKCLEFIDRHQDSPFFMYICHHCSHRPLQVARSVYEKYEGLGYSRNMTIIRAMYDVLDGFIGDLLDKLENYGISDDTMIIFTSDNGGGENDCQLNGTSRGGKFTLLEGGIRVPLVIRWPAAILPDRIYGYPVINLDFLPTVLAAAGIDAPTKCDGVNLLPYLTGKTTGRPHDALFWTVGDDPIFDDGPWTRQNTPELFGYPPESGDFAVRRGDWKFVSTANGVGLFDLLRDPYELDDLSAQYPDVVHRLLTDYKKWAHSRTRQSFDDEMIRRMKKEQNAVAKMKGDYKYADTFNESRQ